MLNQAEREWRGNGEGILHFVWNADAESGGEGMEREWRGNTALRMKHRG
jgi:hypothetical protein